MYNQPTGPRRLIAAAIVLVLFIIVINLPSLRESNISRFSRKIFLSAAYPFQWVLSGTSSNISGFVLRVATLWGAEDENNRLKSENASLKSRLSLIEGAVSENDSLRKALSFKLSSASSSKLIAAEVVSKSPSNWFETIIINKGSQDGVSKDDIVICKEGVVGRAVEVSRSFSKVMLITDPESSIGVMIKRSKDLGVAVGGAMNSVQVKYIGASASVEAGDEVLTSGIGGLFPKGIPVGVVVRTSARDFDIFRYVELRPMVDFSKLAYLFVVAVR